MGEILYRTKLSEEMFRGLAPWLNLRGGTAPANRDLHMGRAKIATITGPAGEVVELAVP